MTRIRSLFWEYAIPGAVSTFAVAGAFFGTSALIDPANLFPFGTIAPAVPVELTPAELEEFKHQYLEFGLSEDQIFYVDDFAIFEAKLAEKRGLSDGN